MRVCDVTGTAIPSGESHGRNWSKQAHDGEPYFSDKIIISPQIPNDTNETDANQPRLSTWHLIMDLQSVAAAVLGKKRMRADTSLNLEVIIHLLTSEEEPLNYDN